jgi:hypothetical protein
MIIAPPLIKPFSETSYGAGKHNNADYGQGRKLGPENFKTNAFQENSPDDD